MQRVTFLRINRYLLHGEWLPFAMQAIIMLKNIKMSYIKKHNQI